MLELNAPPEALNKIIVTEPEFFKGCLSQEALLAFFNGLLHSNQEFEQPANDNTMYNFLGRQKVSDKAAADAVEAILGAGLKSFGVNKSLKLLEMLQILPPKQNFDISEMLNIPLKSPRLRTNISDSDVDNFLLNPGDLEKIIGYKFIDRGYLLQALTHPSYPTNHITGCYQQLEFLGDAVLDFLITCYIYERCPTMHPGQLTDLRSALVNNVTLACLLVRNNLHNFILYQNSKLAESIGKFYLFQEERNHEVTEHVQLLTTESETNSKLAEYTEVPKTLGDVFEAIVGGVYLDSGNNLLAAWKVIYQLMNREIHKFMNNVPYNIVRQLYEMQGVNPVFDEPTLIADDENVLINLNFTLNGVETQVHGFGSNKENAKKAAAKTAMILLTNKGDSIVH